MRAPVKLGLYVALLAAIFGAAYFTAQVVVEADTNDDWRPQIHQTTPGPDATEEPTDSGQPEDGGDHGDMDDSGDTNENGEGNS